MPSDFQRLVIHLMTLEAVPEGGGIGDGMNFLKDPKRISSTAKKCTQQADDLCQAIINTPDNPYGDDKNAIAAEILRRVKERQGGAHNA